MPSPSSRPLILALAAVLTLVGPALATPSAVVRGAGAQSADGQNRRVRIHNQTGWTLTALSLSDAGRSGWRAAALGKEAVPTGDSVLVNVDDGAGSCVYVIRAEFSNGQSLERSNVNACQIADYYFTR